MQLRRVFRYFAQVLLVTGAVSLVMGGCSRQGEGERCDLAAAGDSDCDDGLVCKPCGELDVGPVDRCCPPDGRYTDERCIPGKETVCYRAEDDDDGSAGASSEESGGTGGTGGTGATGGTDGAGATGATGAEGGTGASSGSGGAAGDG